MKRFRFALIAVVIVLCTVNVLYAGTETSKRDVHLTASTGVRSVKTYNDPDDHYKYRKYNKAYKEKTVSGFLANQNPGGYKLSGYLTYTPNKNGGVSVSFSFPKPFNCINYTVPMGEYNGGSSSGVGCSVEVPDNRNFYKLKATKTVRITPWIQERRSFGSKKWKFYAKGYKKEVRCEEYYCVPLGTNIQKITPGKTNIKVSWKSNKYTGYQISYSKNSKMTSAKTIKTSAQKTSTIINKLARKQTYYVRIRTYKTFKGKTRYSTWSGIKKAKTK